MSLLDTTQAQRFVGLFMFIRLPLIDGVAAMTQGLVQRKIV